MPAQAEGSSLPDIDAAMAEWRQGDVLLNIDLPFVTFAHARVPLFAPGQADLDEEGPLLDVATDEVGFVVLSQSCDIVRAAQHRPYVELAPLVPVSRENLLQIRSGRSTRFVSLPAMDDQSLVADLDRVMTVQKPLLAAFPRETRQSGCRTDEERRRFAEALARRYSRIAFPDDFNRGMKRVVSQINKRHGKASPLGTFLANVEDVRAQCPDWTGEDPEVQLLFVFLERSQIPDDADEHIEELLGRFEETGGFTVPSGRAVAYDTMSAELYRTSDRLDFEYLSTSS